MTIRFTCRCGARLRADDDEAGERIRCEECGKSITVPDGDPADDDDRPSRRRRDDDDEEPRRRLKSRAGGKRRSSGGGSNAALYLGIGGGVLLVGLIVGLIVMFSSSSSKSSVEQTLVGEWEADPEQGDRDKVAFAFNTKLSFRADHTHQLTMLMPLDGRWQVVSRDGNRLQVRMIHKIMGLEQNDPPTATITILDKDHLEFAANERSLQLNGRFRRVGTGPAAANPVANAGPAKEPNPPNPPENPFPNRQDDGVAADCEVQWGGTWFKAKVLKAEKDRWFIHYLGWANTWDEWVGQDRIRFLK